MEVSSFNKEPKLPKSPPGKRDLHSYRNMKHLANLQVLEKEITSLQDELKSLDSVRPSSRCCKEVNEFVTSKSDPLINIDPTSKRSCCLWTRITRIKCCCFSYPVSCCLNNSNNNCGCTAESSCSCSHPNADSCCQTNISSPVSCKCCSLPTSCVGAFCCVSSPSYGRCRSYLSSSMKCTSCCCCKPCCSGGCGCCCGISRCCGGCNVW